MTQEELEDLLDDGYQGWYRCPYCANVQEELLLCCGEMHSVELQENTVTEETEK